MARLTNKLVKKMVSSPDPARYAGYWKDLIAHVKDNNATNPTWSAAELSQIACPTSLIA